MICNHNCRTYSEHSTKLHADRQQQLDSLALWLLDSFDHRDTRNAWLLRAWLRRAGKASASEEVQKLIRRVKSGEYSERMEQLIKAGEFTDKAKADAFVDDIKARAMRIYNERVAE